MKKLTLSLLAVIAINTCHAGQSESHQTASRPNTVNIDKWGNVTQGNKVNTNQNNQNFFPKDIKRDFKSSNNYGGKRGK